MFFPPNQDYTYIYIYVCVCVCVCVCMYVCMYMEAYIMLQYNKQHDTIRQWFIFNPSYPTWALHVNFHSIPYHAVL